MVALAMRGLHGIGHSGDVFPGEGFARRIESPAVWQTRSWRRSRSLVADDRIPHAVNVRHVRVDASGGQQTAALHRTDDVCSRRISNTLKPVVGCEESDIYCVPKIPNASVDCGVPGEPIRAAPF